MMSGASGSGKRIVIAPNSWLYVKGLNSNSMLDAERLLTSGYEASSFHRLTPSSAYVSFQTIEAASKVSTITLVTFNLSQLLSWCYIFSTR